MIYYDSEKYPKFISTEERLSPEELQGLETFFAPLSESMSAILGQPVKVELRFDVDDLPGWVDKRVRVNFYTGTNDSKRVVAEINWRSQNHSQPSIMEDGVIDIFAVELRGHDFGYQMFLAKREIGRKFGYRQILLNSSKGKGGYSEHIISKQEEEKYGWRKMSPQEDGSYLGDTYIGNILSE